MHTTDTVSRRRLLGLVGGGALAALAGGGASLVGCSSGGYHPLGSRGPLSAETRQTGLWAGQSARLTAYLLRLGPDGPEPREGNLTPDVRYRITSQNAEGYQVRYFTGPGFATDLGAVNVQLSDPENPLPSPGDPEGIRLISATFDVHAPTDAAVGEGEAPAYQHLSGSVSVWYVPADTAGEALRLFRAQGYVARSLRSPERFTDEFNLRFDAAGVAEGTYQSHYRDKPWGGGIGAGIVGPGAPSIPEPSATLTFTDIVRAADGTFRAAFSSSLGVFAGEVTCAPDSSGRITGVAPEAGAVVVDWDTAGGGTLTLPERAGEGAAPQRLARVYGDWWHTWSTPPLSASAPSGARDPWSPW